MAVPNDRTATSFAALLRGLASAFVVALATSRCAQTTRPSISIPPECAALGAAECAQLAACEPELLRQSVGDRCTERISSACAAIVSAPGVALTTANVATCAEAWRAATCSQVLAGGLCSLPTGTLPASSPCFVATQCRSGRCDVPVGSACGVCHADPTTGSPCHTDADCTAAHLRCSAGGQCAAPVPSGSPCNENTPCLAGNECDATWHCAPLAGVVGASCVASCANGLVCVHSATGGRCVTWPSIGEPCGGDEQRCLPGLICSDSGACIEPTYVTGFTACGTGSAIRCSDLACETGARLRVRDGGIECLPPAEDGQPCGERGCLPYSVCVGSTDGGAGLCSELNQPACR